MLQGRQIEEYYYYYIFTLSVHFSSLHHVLSSRLCLWKFKKSLRPICWIVFIKDTFSVMYRHWIEGNFDFFLYSSHKNIYIYFVYCYSLIYMRTLGISISIVSLSFIFRIYSLELFCNLPFYMRENITKINVLCLCGKYDTKWAIRYRIELFRCFNSKQETNKVKAKPKAKQYWYKLIHWVW